MPSPTTHHNGPGGARARYALSSRFLLLGLTAAPFVLLATLVARYSVDLPCYDQWDFVPLLARWAHGQFPLSALWVHNAEHRLFFSRVILLWLARLTAWNTRVELALNLGVAVLTFGVLAHLLQRCAREAGLTGASWALPVFSLILFGTAQIQNWLWGWQLAYFLCVLGVVTGISLLTSVRLTWWRYAGAVAAGVLASYSFASGLPYWPLGVVALVTRPAKHRREKLLGVAVWTVVSALVVGAYFHGYQQPGWHARPSAALAHPARLLEFALLQSGFPINSHHPLRTILFGLAAASGALIALLRTYRRPVLSALPFGLLALYALANAVLVGVGRIGFGMEQAISSRYVTFACLFWVGTAGLLALLLAAHRGGGAAARVHVLVPVAAGVALIGLAGAALRTSLEAVPGYAVVYRERREARAALLAGRESPALDVLFPSRPQLWSRAAELRALRYSLFREEAASARSSGSAAQSRRQRAPVRRQ